MYNYVSNFMFTRLPFLHHPPHCQVHSPLLITGAVHQCSKLLLNHYLSSECYTAIPVAPHALHCVCRL